MNKIQFTFYNPEGKYKPITVTLTPRSEHEKISELKSRAIQKVKAERLWSNSDLLVKYKYTKCRFREVDEKGQPIRKINKRG